MTLPASAVERAAKGIYDSWANYPRCAASKSWDEICSERPPEANDFRRKGHAALTAALGDEYVIVPREPTPEMCHAAWDVIPEAVQIKITRLWGFPGLKIMARAMLTAAHSGKPG